MLRFLVFCDVTFHHWASGSHCFKETWYEVDYEPLKMKATCSTEIMGAMYPATEPHIPEDWYPD
jgi:hypothetical protein